MKKHLSFLLLSFVLFNITNAQTFEITSKNNFKVKAFLDPEDFYYDYKAYSTFKNTSPSGSVDTVFVWEKKIVKMTNGWLGTVCDPIGCHIGVVTKSVFNKSVGKTGLIDVGFMPQGIAGEAIVELKVYPADKPQLAKTFIYSFVIENPTGVNIADNYISNEKLYPNPTNSILNIDLQLKTNQNIRLEIIDLNGKQVITSIFETGIAITKSVDLSALPEGIYQISYFANDVRIMTKSFLKL